MRTRSFFSSLAVGLASLALVAPAAAQAESFPSKASSYVGDHTGYFVAALLAAILLLLLVVSITQRRAKEKAKSPGAKAPAPAPPPLRPAPQALLRRRPRRPGNHRYARRSSACRLPGSGREWPAGDAAAAIRPEARDGQGAKTEGT